MRTAKSNDTKSGNESSLLVFHLKTGRSKAMEAARLEALTVLESCGVPSEVVRGGPLSERGQIFCVRATLSDDTPPTIPFDRLGYSVAVDLALPIRNGQFRDNRPDVTTWSGRPFKLERLYDFDPAATRERDPDQRRFLLAEPDGSVKEVRGYRGNGTALGKRAFPVCDAQLLVNIVKAGPSTKLLDPFGGAGGIILEAVRVGALVYSVDIDPILRPGLEMLGAKHFTGSATQLPFDDESFEAVATEPPFDQDTQELILGAFDEMFRVVRVGGRIAVYCADWQAQPLLTQARHLPLQTLIDMPVDRKGYPCHILAWEKRDW
jgi:Methyltransferase domain